MARVILFAITTLLVGLVTSTHPSSTLDVWCFGCGNGVARLDAGVAAQAACQYWWQTVMYPNTANKGGLGFSYTWSGGSIGMSVVPFWTSSMSCNIPYNDFFSDFNRCYEGFMTPVDSCNTDGVNGKQGGYYWDYCADVTINPNPQGCGNGNEKFAVNTTSDGPLETYTHFATDAEHERAIALLQADNGDVTLSSSVAGATASSGATAST